MAAFPHRHNCSAALSDDGLEPVSPQVKRRALFRFVGMLYVVGERHAALRQRAVVGDVGDDVSTGRGISSLWGAQFSPLGGDGDQPFERSAAPCFGGRPRRLIGAVDD
jgi:hypothetical protein